MIKKLSLPRSRLSLVSSVTRTTSLAELGGQFSYSLDCFSQSCLRLNKSGRTGLHPCQRLKVAQDHRGEEELLPDGLVSIFAEFAPEVTILQEIECISCSCLRIINQVAVIAVSDLHL